MSAKQGQAPDQFLSIAPDVKLGEGVKLSKFINLYGCAIGDEHKDRRLRRDSEERQRRARIARSPAILLSAKA